MVASTSWNSVELARAIASMHTILRTGSVIASGLDDQRYALGDWRSVLLSDGPATPRTDCSLMTGDELHRNTAVVVVGRGALALVGAISPPATRASIAARMDTEVGLSGRSRRDWPGRQLRDSVTHGQVSGSSSSPAP